MKETVFFFWNRYNRAAQMDAANKINGKPTHFWISSIEWVDAYKATLSGNKVKDFDKEWARLDQQRDDFVEGKKGSKSMLL